MSEFQKDSLSLEETNKVRISLGLPPLQPDSDEEEGGNDESRRERKEDEEDDPLKNQEEKAAKNYARYQEEAQRKRDEEQVRERIARAQNKRDLNRKLRGPTLGDAEPSGSSSAESSSSKSTLKWLKAAQKKAKENAAKRLKEEAEEEERSVATSAKYDSEDLAGLKVGHDMDDIDLEAGGEGRVLTLKDSKILEGDDDELMDSAVEAAEKDRINAERKKGVKKYTGLDDDDFGADQIGRKKSVLSKYDNDIEGGALRREDGGFVLGVQSVSKVEREEAKKRQSEKLLNRTLLDLDYTKNTEVSDYLQEGDAGFKKPKGKKKKRGSTRIRLDDDDDEPPTPASYGDVEMGEGTIAALAGPSRRLAPSDNDLIDDEDLSVTLAKARREKAKKAFQKMTPEMIARNLAEQREAEEAERLAAANGTPSGTYAQDGATGAPPPTKQEDELVFDDTSEFVRNINEARQISPETEARQARRAAASLEASRRQREEAEAKRATAVKEEAASPLPLDTKGVDASTLLGDVAMKEEEEDASEEEEGMTNGVSHEGEQEEETADPLVSGGMAAALSLLRQQGLITSVTPEQQEKERKQKEYDAWLATRRFEDRVREAELAASKAQGSAKDQATREYENRMRELEDARNAQEKFKNYMPNIDIKYNDEFGRNLNHHEAWKRLSHTFHGKMPGQKKQEQRLQRIMDERKQEKMLAGDTPSGMTKAFADRAERSGQAHMVLGVGSKNNAPQDIGLLGPNTVGRPSKEKSSLGASGNKGKERENDRGGRGTSASNGTSTVMTNGHGGGLDSSVTGITSMVPRSTTTKARAGFAPVKNAASSSNGQTTVAAPASMVTSSSAAAAAPPSKFKLAFNKRPAVPTEQGAEPQAKHFKMEKSGE